MRKAFALIFLALLLAGCRTKYVSVPEYHTEYRVRTDTVHRVDSFTQHDSVAVWVKADTVYKERWRTKELYKYLYKNSTDTLLKTDSVRVPYPVEKKLSRSQRAFITMGKIAMGALVAVVIAAAVWLAVRLGGKSRE